MFKKLKESGYWKASIAILICGGILIVFANWVSRNRISIGFEAVNEAMAPIYIGIILAFLMCPVYNRIVAWTYSKMVAGAGDKSASIGTMKIHGEPDPERVTRSEKRTYLSLSRAIASFICLLVVVGLIALMFYAIVPQCVTSSMELVDTLPERLSSLSDWLEVNFSRFPMLAKWVDNLANAGTDTVVKWVQKNVISGDAVSVASAVSTGVLSAVNFVVDAFVGILIMIYLLNYKERLFAIVRKFIAATCKPKTQDGLFEFSDIVNDTFIGFIVGRIIDSFIIGVLTYIVLVIANISFAPMISVIVGVTNVIPFFGPFIGAIPSFLILMLENPTEALWFLVIILIIQQLDGNVIGPKVVGNSIGLDSFWVLVAVLIGGGLFGFAGMLLGVPVFAVIYKYVNKLTMRSLRSKNKASHTSDYFTLEQFGVDASEINLENVNPNEKNFISKFRKTSAVQEEIVEEAKENELKKQQEADDLEELKNQIARELLAAEPPKVPEKKTSKKKTVKKAPEDVNGE